MRGAPVLVPLFLFAACTASPSTDDPWAGGGAPGPATGTVGWLGDRPVTYGEVARYLRAKDPDLFVRTLEGLVLERATRTEAGPLGVRVPAPVLARATRARLAAWRTRLADASKRETGAAIDPALYLERTAGLSVAAFETLVQRHTEVELLQDRLLRYEQRVRPSVSVTLVIAADVDGAAAAAAALREGGDAGGERVDGLVPADIPEAAARDALFAAAPGAVVGPVEAGGALHVYRVEAVHAARPAPYDEAAAAIERGLEKRPVPVGEYVRWRRRILLRHGFVAAPPDAPE